MKVTVCELSNDSRQFEKDWDNLVHHCQSNLSELVLLSEMPFYQWIAFKAKISKAEKSRAVDAHKKWMDRIPELGKAMVAYSIPWIKDGKFFNSAYIWTEEKGHQKVHTKYFFPEEEGFYEDTWFDREPENFEVIDVRGVKIGFLLCTEIWFTQYARKYGLEEVDFLLCPRATGKSSIPQWIRCGQTSAVISGGYCLSSNRSGRGEAGFDWGGTGWVCQPLTGELLGITTRENPFLTINTDLSRSKLAKKEYPLYVRD